MGGGGEGLEWAEEEESAEEVLKELEKECAEEERD